MTTISEKEALIDYINNIHSKLAKIGYENQNSENPKIEIESAIQDMFNKLKKYSDNLISINFKSINYHDEKSNIDKIEKDFEKTIQSLKKMIK